MMLKVQVQDEDLFAKPEFVDFFRFRLDSDDVTGTYKERGHIFVRGSHSV